MPSPKNLKTIAAIFAIIAWLGVILQFYTAVPGYLAKGRTLGGTLVELFSFFTIQTNIVVALCFTMAAIGASQKSFFQRRGVLTATASNIGIVALVYNLVLRQTYHPVGLARVSDEIVHVVTPACFIIYWLLYVPKANFKWADSLPWLWYPLVYLFYILIRGAACGIYPYFFLDATKFRYPQVSLNIGVLLVVFLGMGMLFIFIGKIMNRNRGF